LFSIFRFLPPERGLSPSPSSGTELDTRLGARAVFGARGLGGKLRSIVATSG
jgi:hypothetical protein